MTTVKAKSAHGRAYPCTQVFFPIAHLERHVGRERERGGGGGVVREKVDVSTTKISRGSMSRSLLHSPVPSANSLAPFFINTTNRLNSQVYLKAIKDLQTR